MTPKFESKPLWYYLDEDLLDEPDYFLEILDSLDNLFNNESNDTAYLSTEINNLISLLFKQQQNEDNNN